MSSSHVASYKSSAACKPGTGSQWGSQLGSAGDGGNMCACLSCVKLCEQEA